MINTGQFASHLSFSKKAINFSEFILSSITPKCISFRAETALINLKLKLPQLSLTMGISVAIVAYLGMIEFKMPGLVKTIVGTSLELVNIGKEQVEAFNKTAESIE